MNLNELKSDITFTPFEKILGDISSLLTSVDACNEFLASVVGLVEIRLMDIEAEADDTRRGAMYALDKIAKLNH